MTTHPDPTTFTPSEDLTDALVTVSFLTTAIITRIGADHDLSLTMVRVLGILWDRHLRITELADYLGLEKQTMSGLVSRAQQRGLVTRTPNTDDARATDIRLTSKGIELVADLHTQVWEALAPLLAPLSATDQHALADLLGRLSGVRRVDG